MTEAIQVTAPCRANDTIQVAGSACPPPYRCSTCPHFRVVQEDGEFRRVCTRKGKTAEINARDWLFDFAAHVEETTGRATEIKRTKGGSAVFREGLA